ncbi:uncharacterized protein LOC100870040 [Apis florea]|uniref:uncharacterized protein LOC100870040 n=1 Tax=Apis florea TaxID=7463 RepID=UPI000252C41C|nr:uncharacterized protein LOC100870040 [Apis florea]
MRRILGEREISTFCILLLFCPFDLSVCLPAEQPIRYTLNTGNVETRDTGTPFNFEQNRAVASESQNNAVTVEKSVSMNYEPIQFGTTQYPPVTNTHSSARETARLENETAQSFFERPVANVLNSFLKPTPLVDSIKEEEKYGNSGDKFIGIGRALVTGYQEFSNFLNTLVDMPRKTAKKASSGISGMLNYIGARLIGLE